MYKVLKIDDIFFFFSLDITAVCLLEGFSNQNNMMLAESILKTFGQELAKKHIKVHFMNFTSHRFFISTFYLKYS